MGPVRGRRDDMLILRGVNVYPSEIEHVLLGVEGVAPHYELTVERPGASDEVRVRCEARAGGDDLAARVHAALRERTGIGIEVELVEGAPSRAARARPRGSSTSGEAQGSVALCAAPPCVHVTVTFRPTAVTRTCAMSSGAATVAISWTTPFCTSVAAPNALKPHVVGGRAGCVGHRVAPGGDAVLGDGKRAHLRRRVAVADDLDA